MAFLTVAIGILLVQVSGYVPERVYDTGRQAFADLEVVLADIATADVVFVGEQHDDPNTHRLEAALLELPAGYRTVLVLHDIHGFSHEECAEVLNCRVGTSKSQLHKARARMRELLAPWFGKREVGE